MMKTMVDTIKLLLTISDPLQLNGNGFSPTLAELVQSKKYNGKAVLNPPKAYAAMGKYMPRLTMHKRPSKSGPVYQLAIELSAPKMIFGNNFDEITEQHLDQLVTAIQDTLFELIGRKFFRGQLLQADLGAWHPCKNIVFLDFTAASTIINTIGKLDISQVYDFQHTNFRDGHVAHIHCNSLDIAFYDKMADLRKAKISDKRAIEKDNRIQLGLFDKISEHQPLEVVRYEVRLNGKPAIKRAFPELAEHNLETLFKQSLCRQILIKHWKKLTASVDLLALDVKQPYELLTNYMAENPEATPQATLAAVAGLMVISQVGVMGLRTALEAKFGSHSQVWHRIKHIFKAPQAYRFTHFQRIDEVLDQFLPTRMTDFLKIVESSGN